MALRDGRQALPAGPLFIRIGIDMHFFDGTHLLLETHHEECAHMIRTFIVDVERKKTAS